MLLIIPQGSFIWNVTEGICFFISNQLYWCLTLFCTLTHIYSKTRADHTCWVQDYFWVSGTMIRAHIKATLDSCFSTKRFTRKKEVILKGRHILTQRFYFWYCLWKYLLCTSYYSCYIWLLVTFLVPLSLQMCRWALKTLANQPAVCLLYHMKETLGSNVFETEEATSVTSISGIIGDIADVKTENISQKSEWMKIVEWRCPQVSQPAGQRNKDTLNCFWGNVSVNKPAHEKNNNEKHLCTVQSSKCNVPQLLHVWDTNWYEYVSEQIFSLTNLQRYIILDCVFIVCNVYISLQLFAHINKRFN